MRRCDVYVRAMCFEDPCTNTLHVVAKRSRRSSLFVPAYALKHPEPFGDARPEVLFYDMEHGVYRK